MVWIANNIKKKTPRSRYNETEKCISDKTFMNYENILFRWRHYILYSWGIFIKFNIICGESATIQSLVILGL